MTNVLSDTSTTGKLKIKGQECLEIDVKDTSGDGTIKFKNVSATTSGSGTSGASAVCKTVLGLSSVKSVLGDDISGDVKTTDLKIGGR